MFGVAMPRGPQHSSNWGGRRKGAGGAGGRKKGGVNKMTAEAVTMAEQADIHPFTFLLSVVANKEASLRDRLNASAAALPYCLSKKATELIVTNDLEHKTVSELEGRLASVHRELLEMGATVIEGELVNGS
jgi:hypothetical protein